VGISVVDNEGGLERLQVDWNRLLHKSCADTIFLTWEWIMAWWKSYGAGKELWVLKVDMDGDLVGLAPLYRKNFSKFGVFQYSGLYLIGEGSADSDYLDVIIEAGREEAVARSIVTFLLKHRDQWDILFLNEVPETSKNLTLLRRFFQAEGCFWEEDTASCAEVRLPLHWDEYLKSLKPRMRTKIRSLTQRLENSHTVLFDCCTNLADLWTRLESLFRLHRLRWQMNGKEGVFLLPNKRQRLFYPLTSPLFLSNSTSSHSRTVVLAHPAW